ncbi:MAG: hypothetical protein KJO07_10970, partial [Deltaproteobacteria bacterium]|nr:hypothetical protein [Deltaproteobacteria bacterium]
MTETTLAASSSDRLAIRTRERLGTGPPGHRLVRAVLSGPRLLALAIGASMTVVLVLMAWRAVENRVEARARAALAAHFGAGVDVGEVELGWGRVTLRDISAERAGLRIERADLEVRMGSVIRGQQRIEAIALDGVQARLIRGSDGAWQPAIFDGTSSSRSPSRHSGSRLPDHIELGRLAITLDDQLGEWSGEVGAVSGRVERTGGGFRVRAREVSVELPDSPWQELVGLDRLDRLEAEISRSGGDHEFVVGAGFAGDASVSARGRWQEGGKLSADVELSEVSVDRGLLASFDLPMLPSPQTRLSGSVAVAADGKAVQLGGAVSFRELAVIHPLLAAVPLTGITGRSQLAVRFDRDRE